MAKRQQALVNEWLLSLGERLQHVRVDGAFYDTLQANIVAAVDQKWLEREALKTVPVVPYHSPIPNAELLCNSTSAAVVVYDGLIALLSLLNEAFIDVLLASQTTGIISGRLAAHMDRLVSLLLYWAIDPETDMDIPAIRALEGARARPEAAMFTQYQQAFVVCHELGHFVLNWASIHPQVGPLMERHLASAAKELEDDLIATLTIRDKLSWNKRILDECRSDYIAVMLYRSFIDRTGLPEQVRDVAQAAPSLFFHYVGIADYLRDLSASFQFEPLEELLSVGLRATMSSATHLQGHVRQENYQKDTGDWLSGSSRRAISSIDRIMEKVWACAGSPSELGCELWGSLLRPKREGESDGSW